MPERTQPSPSGGRVLGRVARESLREHARSRGWQVVSLREGGVILECVECGARIERSPRALLSMRSHGHVVGSGRHGFGQCSHPAVDEARRYNEDLPCRLLVHRFGPMTLDEVGQAMGFTRERARQIEEKALRHLRARFRVAGWAEDEVRELLAHLARREATNAPEDSPLAERGGQMRGVTLATARARREGADQAAPEARAWTLPSESVRRRRIIQERGKEEAMATKTCATCAEEFEGHNRSKYCSDGCRPSRAANAKGRRSKTAVGAKLNEAIEGAGKGEAAGGGNAHVCTPRQVLELAGYSVTEVVTPAGVLLRVEGE